MIKMSLRILSAKKRKNILSCLVVTFCVLFILVINTVYVGYCNVQIENGYHYGGRWDIAVKIDAASQDTDAKTISDMTLVGTINNTYSARLDAIPEDEKEGPYAVYADHYYLSLLEIGSIKDNVLPYELLEGNWPRSNNEIVIPERFEYNGISVRQGDLKVGDKISLELGQRIKSDGTITQDQIEDTEEFINSKVKEFTVSGIMKYDNYTTGNYVTYGYMGSDNANASTGEVVTKYYKLNHLNPKNLHNEYKKIINNKELLNVEKNNYIENALYVVYESDLMKSIKYGLYIFEAFIILLGFGIICVNQYQNIKEDEKSLVLLHSIGAEQKHIRSIYYFQNFIVGITGLSVALLLFVGIKRMIYAIFPMIMRSKNMSLGILDISTVFIVGELLITLLGMLLIARILVKREFAKICIMKRRKKKQSIRSASKKRAPVRSIFGLALNNIKFAKARNRILTLIFTIIIIVISVGLPVCLSVYHLSVAASKAESAADFYLIMNGISDKHDKDLDKLNSISCYYRQYTSNQLCYIPAKALGDRVVKQIKLQYPDTPGNTYKPFNDKNEYNYSASIISVNEKFYNSLKKMNNYLPSFKEFASGDNCMIFGTLYISAEDETINVGKIIGANMKSIDFYSRLENPVITHLQIQSIVEKCRSDVFKDYVVIDIYVPEKLYLEKMSMNSFTMYFVDGYSGRTNELGEQLKLLSNKDSFLVQDNVSASSAAKDSLTIQYISIAVGMIMMVLLGIVSIYVVMKYDFISRTETYISYRTIGLERRQAVFLQFSEQLISLVNAVIVSSVALAIFRFTILRGIMAYYGVGLNDIAFIMIPAIIFIILLILWNSVRVSRERYKIKISSAFRM